MKRLLTLCVAVVAVAASPASGNPASNGGRVYNGYPASAGQFPYQALFLIDLLPSNQEACGGSIITANYILSAAHCFSGKEWSSAVVYLGLTKKIDQKIFVDRVTAANVVIHPRYTLVGTATHDLALIRLNQLVPFSRYPNELQAVLLPNVTSNGYVIGTDPSVFDNLTAVVSGWGKTNNSDNSILPANMQYVNVNVMPHDRCVQFFQQNTRKVITNAHICSDKTLPPYGGPCQGDSGGPLALRVITPERQVDTYLLGVVSFNYARQLDSGITACINPNPAVYVNVAYHVPWILTVLLAS